MEHIYTHNNLYVFRNTMSVSQLEKAVLPIFSNTEYQKYKAVKHENRKKERLGIRYILSFILYIKSELKYSPFGNPYLSDGTALSISHTADILSLTLGQNSFCGLDIELISNRIEKIATKFIKPVELAQILTQKQEHLHLQWSAKEVLFKIYKKGGIDYRENLTVEIPEQIKNEGTIASKINLPDFQKKLMLNYKILEINRKKYMLVWIND